MDFELDPATGHFVRQYTTDDGLLGVHVVSRDVLASRMALLGIDDPMQALAALVSEMEVPQDVEPFTPIFDAIKEAAAVDKMRRESIMQGLGDPLEEPVRPTPQPMARMMSMRPQTMAARILSGDPVVEEQEPDTPPLSATAPTPAIPLLTPDTLHEIPVVASAQEEARSLMPITVGPRTKSQEEFAEMVRTAFGDELDQMRRDMIEELRRS